MNLTDFETAKLGTVQECPADALMVEVTIDPSVLVPEYAQAYADECYRVQETLAERLQISADELSRYFTFLIAKRVQCVYQVCSDFRLLKALYMPSFVQAVLSAIGIAWDREEGIKFIPTLIDVDDLTKATNEKFEDMLAISEKLAYFESYVSGLVRDAMPRDVYGDLSFMSSTLIGDVIYSHKKQHPTIAYAVALLNMRVKETISARELYRIRQGDLSLISQVLIHDRGFRR